MPCRVYENRLSELEDYLEGTLAGDAQAQLASHLAGCATCREAVEEARACGVLLREAIAPASAIPLADAFWQRIQAGIRTATRRDDFWGSFEWLARRVAWSAAVIALLLLAGVVEKDYAKLRQAAAESHDLFPEASQQPPANNGEVLLTLAEGRRQR